MALASHPQTHTNDLIVNSVQFREACEAFDILSNGKFQLLENCLVELRAIYDKYGDFGLREGFSMAGERVGGGYFLKVAPEVIYDKIFNAIDPWGEQDDFDGNDTRASMFADSFGANNRPAHQTPNDAEITVECTLEEFYNGSIKHVVYEIDEVQHDARTVKLV